MFISSESNNPHWFKVGLNCNLERNVNTTNVTDPRCLSRNWRALSFDSAVYWGENFVSLGNPCTCRASSVLVSRGRATDEALYSYAVSRDMFRPVKRTVYSKCPGNKLGTTKPSLSPISGLSLRTIAFYWTRQYHAMCSSLLVNNYKIEILIA